MEKVRKSSYIINVKLESEENAHMLIHGYTGAIDVVNSEVADYLENGQDFSMESIPFSTSTYEALSKRGYLTTKTEEEELQNVIKLAEMLHKTKKILLKSFVFMVAYDCNFRCPYCYEGKVLSGSRQWTRKVFTKEMVDKVYAAINQIEPEPRLRPKNVTLYGGEPLLKENKEVVEYILTKGKEMGFNFFAVTNGYDLHEFKHLLGPENISLLQITLDGLEPTHNSRRFHYADKNTFQRIIENIGIALDCGTNISLRVNTDGNNFNDLDHLNELLNELGYFAKKGKLSPYSARLFDYNKKEDFIYQKSNKNKKLDYLDEKTFNALHKESDFKHSCNISNKAMLIKKAILKNARFEFSPIYCSAQSGSYIFDPFGEIYGCWNEVGNKKKIIGNYLEDEIAWSKNKDLWHSQNIGTSQQCSECKYAFICYGGCISHNDLRKGIAQPGYCNDFSEIFENAVNLAYSDIKKMRNSQTTCQTENPYKASQTEKSSV